MIPFQITYNGVTQDVDLVATTGGNWMIVGFPTQTGSQTTPIIYAFQDPLAPNNQFLMTGNSSPYDAMEEAMRINGMIIHYILLNPPNPPKAGYDIVVKGNNKFRAYREGLAVPI